MPQSHRCLLTDLGIESSHIQYNLSKSQLFRAAIQFDRGRRSAGSGFDEQKAFATQLGQNGPLIFLTDPECTGRPVDDTYAVAWPEVESTIWWKDSLKQFNPDDYEQLLARVIAHLNQYSGALYVQDVVVGQDESYAIPYRFVGQYATHAYFACNMFVTEPARVAAAQGSKRWTMLNVQTYECEPQRDGCNSNRAAILDFRNRICLVVGPADYCGLVKKSIFTVMNYLLPNRDILSMHSSANTGNGGDAAILFGLSGTGKTTLSADPNRKLIGDDETGWNDRGLSNLEDGCYAKLINLDKQAEPVIANALSEPGTLIENVPPLNGVPYAQTHPQELDLFDASLTENTRFSYPLSCNPNVAQGAKGDHPTTVVLLTADAFGVLPPISILDEEEVVYHFVQGFTARVAGTEIGVTQPEATFSSCYGAPFMSHKPMVYAKLLKEKIRTHKSRCVLLNTGWIGGSAGNAPRISIAATRALLNAAMRGVFHDPASGIELKKHPTVNLRYPTSCPGVDPSILDPRQCWSDKGHYDMISSDLREMFRENFQLNQFGSFGITSII